MRTVRIAQVVSLLTTDEMSRYGLTDMGSYLAAADICHRHFPIQDYGVPDDDAAFHALVDALAANIRAGRNVHVHCAAGIGRSGLVSVGVLMQLGVDLTVARDHVSRVRGCNVPETSGQEHYLAAFESRLRGP
ncbi:MAG: dual specificity protein phosphatase family protein [Pseudomonadota bacterium]